MLELLRMKATLFLMAVLVAPVMGEEMENFIGGVYQKEGFYADCGDGIAVGPGGAIIKCGDTYLTPTGVYVNSGGTYLGPRGKVVVKVGSDFVGTTGFTARAGDMYLSASSVSVGLRGAMLVKSVLK
jgi:hypothetical protein